MCILVDFNICGQIAPSKCLLSDTHQLAMRVPVYLLIGNCNCQRCAANYKQICYKYLCANQLKR